MKMLLGILMGCGLLGWLADDADKTPADALVPTDAPAVRATATAPASADSPSVIGLRGRPRDPRRRDMGSGGGAGPRALDRMRPEAEEPLTAQDIDAAMEFARENFPQIHERLERLRQQRPLEFQRMVRRLYGRCKPIMDLKQSNPAAAEKMIEEQRDQMAIAELTDQYRRAKSDEERTRLKGEIEGRLRERFDRRQQRMRSEIDRLRARLDEQEQRLADREKNKEELLRQEFDRMSKGPPPERRPPGAGPSPLFSPHL